MPAFKGQKYKLVARKLTHGASGMYQKGCRCHACRGYRSTKWSEWNARKKEKMKVQYANRI